MRELNMKASDGHMFLFDYSALKTLTLVHDYIQQLAKLKKFKSSIASICSAIPIVLVGIKTSDQQQQEEEEPVVTKAHVEEFLKQYSNEIPIYSVTSTSSAMTVLNEAFDKLQYLTLQKLVMQHLNNKCKGSDDEEEESDDDDEKSDKGSVSSTRAENDAKEDEENNDVNEAAEEALGNEANQFSNMTDFRLISNSQIIDYCDNSETKVSTRIGIISKGAVVDTASLVKRHLNITHNLDQQEYSHLFEFIPDARILEQLVIMNNSSNLDSNTLSSCGGFILVFSYASLETFNSIHSEISAIASAHGIQNADFTADTVPCVLVGMKCGEEDEANEQVTAKQVDELEAKYSNLEVFEVSAEEGNIQEAFSAINTLIVQKQALQYFKAHGVNNEDAEQV